MRSKLALVGLAAAATLALSCDSADTADGVETPGPGSVIDDASGIEFYSPEFEVPEGDSFTCIYLDYDTAEDIAIASADGRQGHGGHHILAMFADDHREPGVHACTDEEMVNLHQIAGTAGDGGQVLGLPEGLALRVPAGKQIVLQAHYINTTGAPFKVVDRVKINKTPIEDVKEYVNYYVTNDDSFEVDPHAPLERTTECVVDRDFNMAIALPHMHELGKHFKLELLDADGTLSDTVIDTDWLEFYVSHPPVRSFEMAAPYQLKKGQRLRQTCTWDNSTSEPVIFPREMCLAFFYYWPGGEDLDCKMVPVPAQ